MKAIADADLDALKDAARKWRDATLSRHEHKNISDVLARLEGPLPAVDPYRNLGPNPGLVSL